MALRHVWHDDNRNEALDYTGTCPECKLNVVWGKPEIEIACMECEVQMGA
jgi:ribosomal protein S27E